MPRNDGGELIGEAEWRALQAVIDELAGEGLDELLAQVHADARSRVRSILTDAMTRSMLSQMAGPRTAARRPPAPAPSPPPEAFDDRSGADSSLALYVYGVLRADDAGAVRGMPGIDTAHAVTPLHDGDLAALVSHVPLAEFDEERLREHLSDMSWVERVARRHEEVLEVAGREVTVIPMRMCSIFRDERGVRTMLKREATGLRRALGELQDKTEWGVKAFRALVTETAPETRTAGPLTGTSYLERQREARQHRERAGASLSAACDSVHATLSALSARAMLLPLQRPEVSGHPGEMLLNGAYLVAADRRDAFHAAVEERRLESASQGVELQLTGPWPAYNFVPDAIGAPA